MATPSEEEVLYKIALALDEIRKFREKKGLPPIRANGADDTKKKEANGNKTS